MSLTQSQIKARKSGIGGSDVAAVLGLNQYTSAVDVWLEKTGRAVNDYSNEKIYWGNKLEKVVADEYKGRHNLSVVRVNQTIRRQDKPFMVANVDRACITKGKAAVIRGGVLRTKHLLECKTAGHHQREKWFNGGETLPINYEAQAQWYLAVTNGNICDVAVLIGGNEYVERRVVADENVQQAMIAKVEKFWVDHVLADTPPPASNIHDAIKLFKADNDLTIQADEWLLQQIEALRKAELAIDEAELVAADIRDKIKLSMKNATCIALGEQKLVTWRMSKETYKTNWQEAFNDAAKNLSNAEINEIIAKHSRTIPSSRRFLIK